MTPEQLLELIAAGETLDVEFTGGEKRALSGAGVAPHRRGRRWPRHRRELEALILRITMTRDNRCKTKFARSQDLRRYSPSLAARAVTHRAMNGWDCWRYEAAPGRWEKLDELRRG